MKQTKGSPKPRQVNYRDYQCSIAECHCITNTKATIYNPLTEETVGEEFICPRHQKLIGRIHTSDI